MATYRELIANLATKAKPEDGALHLILDRWISQAEREAAKEQGGFRENSAFFSLVEKKIATTANTLQDTVRGFELTKLLRGYYLAGAEGNDEKKEWMLKWFHGEYENKREAQEVFGISLIVSDENQYDYLKLFPQSFCCAGYVGTLILFDEAANLYKTPNAITRQHNYEVLFTMYSDMMQSKAQYIGIWVGAIPKAPEDKRRGLFSYKALSSRLAKSCFSRMGSRDLLSPVSRLGALTPGEILMPTEKLSAMCVTLYGDARHFRADGLELSVRICYARVGASTQFIL